MVVGCLNAKWHLEEMNVQALHLIPQALSICSSCFAADSQIRDGMVDKVATVLKTGCLQVMVLSAATSIVPSIGWIQPSLSSHPKLHACHRSYLSVSLYTVYFAYHFSENPTTSSFFALCSVKFSHCGLSSLSTVLNNEAFHTSTNTESLTPLISNRPFQTPNLIAQIAVVPVIRG